MHSYTVTHGDCLYSICQKFGVSDKAVSSINGDMYPLNMGRVLRIPVYSLRSRLWSGQTVSSLANALQIPADRLIPTEDGNIVTFINSK